MYPQSRILIANKKVWTIDTSNMVESQYDYAEWNKPDKKYVYTVWFYLHKILENAN